MVGGGIRMPGFLLSSKLLSIRWWGSGGWVKSFAGNLDWVLALFLNFFPTLGGNSCPAQPTSQRR